MTSKFFEIKIKKLFSGQWHRNALLCMLIVAFFDVLAESTVGRIDSLNPLLRTLVTHFFVSIGSVYAIYWLIIKPQSSSAEGTLTLASTIFDSMVEGVVVQERTGAISEFNAAALEILGLTADQLSGRTSMDPRWRSIRVDGSEFPGHEHPSMLALKLGIPQVGVQMGLELPTGQKKWIHINASPQFLANEKTPYRVVSTFVDITERVVAEGNWRMQEQLFSVATDAMRCGVWDLEPKSGKMICDPNMTQILGLDAVESILTQTDFVRRLSPIYRSTFQSRFQECLQNRDEHFKMDVGIETSGKDLKHVSLAANCFYDDNGSPKRVIGAVVDMTDQRKSQLELQQTLAAINDCAIVSIIDVTGKFLMVNDKLCQVSGYKSAELEGQPQIFFGHESENSEFSKEGWKSIISGISWSGELQLKKKDGSSYWLQSVITPILDLHGQVEKLITISFDVTETRVAQHQLMQSSKMASLGEMAGGIAHEINNPLAIISGKVGAMRKKILAESIDRNRVIEDISKIEKTVERVAKIIRGLKSFSRNAEQDVMSASTMIQVIEETLELCQEKFRNAHVELRVSCESEFPILCRSVQIGQILMNLLGNAFDAIDQFPEKWVEVKVTQSGGTVLVRITDCGKGIAPEVVQKLMEPFYTTKEIGKGTGLGLSISKGIAEDHGGRLYYDTKSAHTSFVLELPLLVDSGSIQSAA